jgi:hypothetical protein
MNVSELTPAVLTRVAFNLREQKFVPNEAGCYVLATFEGTILYVGLTVSLNDRFRAHRNDDEKCRPTDLGRAFWFYYIPLPERELARVERSWQNQHMVCDAALPPLNRVASPILGV